MTVDAKIMWTRVVSIVCVSIFLFFALALWGCNSASQATTAPTPISTQNASADASVPAPAPTPTPIAADPPKPVDLTPVGNCTELDPKKWFGFTYRVQLTFVQMWNASSCDRVVTWRAFSVISESNQPDLGDGIVVIVPAGRQDLRVDVHYRAGVPNLATTCVQIDGRAGRQPNMTHANASFPPGQLFGNCTPPPQSPPPPPPPPPPSVCIPAPIGACGPWTTPTAASVTRQECTPRPWTRSCPRTCNLPPLIEGPIMSCEAPQ